MPDTVTTVYAAGWVKELFWARRRRKNPLNLKWIDYTGQQRFCPMRKNVCFAECKYVSRISLSPTPFRVASDYVKAQAYYIWVTGGLLAGGSLDMLQHAVTCHTRVTNSPLSVAS